MFFIQNLCRIKPFIKYNHNTFKLYTCIDQYQSGFLTNIQIGRTRHLYIEQSHIYSESQPNLALNRKININSFDFNEKTENSLDSCNTEIESSTFIPDESHRRCKLSKRALKNIRSIERLYKQPVDSYEEEFDKTSTIDIEIPLSKETRTSQDGETYEQVKELVKSIYKSSSNGVYNDTLWNRYSKKICLVSSLLHPSDICLVLHSFSKIRYKDTNTLKVLFPLLMKNIGNISCRGLSLVMNSLKRLEVSNYDIIDLVTNEFCVNIDKANLQDIALVANSLSYFQIYHIKFWNSLYNSLLMRHHQIDPLQASLILASLSKLDIRKPLILKILKKRLRPAIESNELSPVLVSLVFHSLAKLDFEAKYFYGSCVKLFENLLSQDQTKVDSQALVLFLYTSVCILVPKLDVIEKSLELLSHKSDYLKSYKMTKLKYMLDHLNHKYKDFVEGLSDELKIFLKKIKDFRVKKIPKKLSRWALEVSSILKESGVEHKKSVLFDYLYADIYIKEYNFVIKCTGPYSYYTKSSVLTKFAKIEQETFLMKGFNVGVLPYYEWNRLKTNSDKLEYLKNFGELAALSLSN